MTTFNSMFGYLETLHKASMAQLNINGNSYALQRDFNQEQQVYYRLGLGKKSDFTLGEVNGTPLKMHKQHISINNKQLERFAKSPYHYTAYFKDPRGQEYVLHVFFNDEDNIEKVKFALQSGAGAQPQLTEAQHHAVIELATEKVQPVMRTLKAELAAKISELKSTYQQIESEATAQHAAFLLSSTGKNRRRYQAALASMVETLSQLTPLLDPTRTPYHGILQFTSAWHAAIQTIRPQAITSPSEQAAETTEETSAPPSIDTATPAAATSTSSTSIAIRKLTAPIALDQEIEKLAAAYQAFASQVESDEIAKQQLDSLLSEIGSIAILLDEKNYTASAKAIKQLYDLRKAIYEQGEKLMVRLLLDPAHVQLAEGWSPFHYVLEGTELLVKAFHATDSKSLSCLLEYGDYEQLEQLSLNINSQAYSSLLHYFLALGKEKQKERLSHVTTLLQHRPGMLLVKDKKTGLPLAHTILTTPGHALQSAIRALKPHQLVKIYKQLIDLPGLSQAQRTNYQANLGIEREKGPLSSTSYRAVFMGETLESMMRALRTRDDAHTDAASQILEQLRNDPDIIAIEQEIVEKTAQMYREIQNIGDRETRNQAMRNLEKIKHQERLSQQQLTKNLPTDAPPSFEEFKEVTMASARQTLAFLNNVENLQKAATRLTTGKKLSKKDTRKAEEVYRHNLKKAEAFEGLCDERVAAMKLDEDLRAMLHSLGPATGTRVVQGDFHMVALPATFPAGHNEHHDVQNEDAPHANGTKARRG
jgi:hypothetical protein